MTRLKKTNDRKGGGEERGARDINFYIIYYYAKFERYNYFTSDKSPLFFLTLTPVPSLIVGPGFGPRLPPPPIIRACRREDHDISIRKYYDEFRVIGDYRVIARFEL